MTMKNTMEKTLSGHRIERLGTFPPVAQFSTRHEYVVGTYLKRKEITVNGKPMTTHNLKANQWNLAFVQGKENVTPPVGAVVSCSGAELDSALADIPEGTEIGIEYLGLSTEKVKGKNARKCFQIVRIEAE